MLNIMYGLRCQSDIYQGDVIQNCCIIFTAPAISIVSSPAGTPVSGSTNTHDYPILSNVTLTCVVEPSPSTTITYQWNTTGCYNNTYYDGGHPRCFPANHTTQSVTGYYLTAEDAGTITCTVTIGGVCYTSEPLTLRISGTNVVSKHFCDNYFLISYLQVLQ